MLIQRTKLVLIWIVVLSVSLLVHLAISWHASRSMVLKIQNADDNTRVTEIEVELSREQAERDELIFEEAIEFEPPEVLVPAAALAPPPPDVNLSMQAAAGGSSRGFSVPLLSDSIATQGKGLAGFGAGVGTGLNLSTQGFAAYVEGLRETGLDVVFVIDSTGSMGWVIDEVGARVVDIVDAVRLLVPVSRFGVVVYRDQGDPDYVTRLQPLTYSLNKLTGFLGSVTGEGGGDVAEAVTEGLRVALQQSGWRLGAKKVVIVIGDAPPHMENRGRILSLSREFATDQGQISTLDVSHESNPALLEAVVGRAVDHRMYRNQPIYDFRQIAEAGGGIAATMDGDVQVTRQLVSLIMGGRFAAETALLLEGFN